MAWEAPPLNLLASGLAAGNRVAGLFDDFQSGLQASDEQRVRGARRDLSGARGPDGQFDIQLASQQLMQAGDIKGAEALSMLALAQEDRKFRQSQAASDSAWKERTFAADQGYRQQDLALRQQGYEQGRVSPGYRSTPEGQQEFIPGSPADPAVIKAQTEARGDIPLTPAQKARAEIDARISAAETAGMDNKSPGYMSYILTGKMPREDAQPLTATDKKAIMDADEAITAAEGVQSLLGKAVELNPKANTGWTAGMRASLGNNLPDWAVPDDISSPESSQATAELDNVVQSQALQQLKSIFGGAPTEGERKILLDIAGSSSLPADVRAGIFKRAQEAVDRRLEFNKTRANQLRGGEYYKPGANPTYYAPEAGPDGGKNQERVPTPGASPAGAGTNSLPVITNPAEAARLPKGTRFMSPDGKIRVVP